MSKRLSIIALVAVALLGTSVVSAVGQTMNWKIVGTSRPVPQWQPWEWFASELDKRSNGKIKVTLVSLPELGLTGFELVRVIKAGLGDGGGIPPPPIAGGGSTLA